MKKWDAILVHRLTNIGIVFTAGYLMLMSDKVTTTTAALAATVCAAISQWMLEKEDK